MTTTTTEASKPLLFCLDKSSNLNLKQCLNYFSTRFFTDGKYLIKSLILNEKSSFIPSALILTGDYNSIKEILHNQHSHQIKTFIFCQNFTRQIYEPLMIEFKSMGLFTTTDDLKNALDDILTGSSHQRQFIRFITNNLDSYLWYEFLKSTSFKIDALPSKQTIDISVVNKKIEDDPLLTLYTLRSSIRNLSQRTISNKKMFYGNVIKKTLIDELQSNIDNIISFNSFIHLQGHIRTLDARHQALQCCSRRQDEVSVIFELELADQPTFKIVRVFNSNDDINLWIVQLVGTHECVKLCKQFSHIKRTTTSLIQRQQPEILFGEILVEMNEIEKAFTYFFQIFVNQYDQLSKIYSKTVELWEQEKKYTEAIDQIALAFQEMRSSVVANKNDLNGKEELTYQESEIESIWEPPIAIQDAGKINDLLPPISYRVDQVLCGGGLQKTLSTTTGTSTSSTRRRCTLF